MNSEPDRNTLIFINVGTSGPDPLKNSMIDVGACLIDTDTCEVIRKFYAIIHHPQDHVQWHPSAHTHWESLGDAGKQILSDIKDPSKSMKPGDAAVAFHTFVMDAESDFPGNMFYSDTAGFDFGWMDRLLSAGGIPGITYIFQGKYRPVFDTTSIHRGVAGMTSQDGRWNAETLVCEALGLDVSVLKSNPYSMNHRSVDRACHLAWEHCIVMNKVKEIKKNFKK